MDPLTILFVSPKRGGIVQSSGFLDLKSLMVLSRTAKAHALDELSLIQLIENEITRDHKVRTLEDAIAFWRATYRYYRLRQWLERDTGLGSIPTSACMLVAGDRFYEVMLVKMLRTIPTESERVRLVEEQGLLHLVAKSNNPVSMRAMLSLIPESWHLRILSLHDYHGWTVLHNVAHSGKVEFIKLILDFYPETERLRAVDETCYLGTVLHCAAWSGNFESIETVLTLYPESERLQTLDRTNRHGDTALHLLAISNNIECIKAVLSLYPEVERLEAVNRQNQRGSTVLDKMNTTTHYAIMDWLQSSVVLKRSHDNTLQTIEEVSEEQPEAKRHRSQ